MIIDELIRNGASESPLGAFDIGRFSAVERTQVAPTDTSYGGWT
jgi:hypothetical protein